jgi:membrane protease YdiL (CAAX protease family)
MLNVSGLTEYLASMLSEKPWRLEAVMLFCAAIFACLFLGMTAQELLRRGGAAGFQEPEGTGSVLLGTLCFQGAILVLMMVFLRRHRVRWSDALGLHGPELKRAVGLAALAVFIILPMAGLMQNFSILVLKNLFGWKPADQLAVSLFKTAGSNWLRAYLGVVAVVIAPVAEEFTFRGMLYPVVKQSGFPRLALFGVSFLFAAIHLDAPTFLPLFVLALCLTWLYEKTDNLLAPITAHMLFNAANLVGLLLVESGVLDASK